MTTDKHTKTDTGAAPGNLGVWFEVYVEDMARARHFYQTLFRVELEELPNLGEDDMQLLAFLYADNTPGIGGALVRHPMRRPNQEGSLVYFACDDVAGAVTRATDLGAEVFVSKQSIGEWSFIAIVGDSEGNVIGLHVMQ